MAANPSLCAVLQRHGFQAMNYMGDDTCEVVCRCRWSSRGHEDEEAAVAALEAHISESELHEVFGG